ncbi:MAG: hypothetical protein ACO2PP_26850 [Thermocrinis sp.]|uniref:hypothetical protein n=1 Tax=Thermocrinis sp. TaxID=2024383 RepID=UPI003C10987F
MFVSLQFKLELKKEDKEKLIKLMRKQSSAIRVAYNMLRELEKDKTKNPYAQIYQRLRELNILTQLSTKLNNIPQINLWYLEVKDSLKRSAKITLQGKQEKNLKINGENKDKDHL